MQINQIIPYKESTQPLGVTLDSRLNWEEHINILSESQSKESIKYYKGGSK